MNSARNGMRTVTVTQTENSSPDASVGEYAAPGDDHTARRPSPESRRAVRSSPSVSFARGSIPCALPAPITDMRDSKAESYRRKVDKAPFLSSLVHDWR